MGRNPKVKLCQSCANWGSMDCPNSSECYALPNKPYWKAKQRKSTIFDIIKSKLKQWQDGEEDSNN